MCYRESAMLTAMSVLILAGCDGQMSGDATGQRIAAAMHCATTADLQQCLASYSLGGHVEIQTRGQLVFAQAFPYSGVQASHLYAYAKQNAGLGFLCFFKVPTQQVVVLEVKNDGTVEMRAEGKNMATLPQRVGSES